MLHTILHRNHEQALEAALKRWRQLLGEHSVLETDTELEAYRSNCGEKGLCASAALKVNHVNKLAAVVQIANEERVAIYPISRGCNWGYGSTQVPAPAVLVDLAAMNRIREYNADLGYVVVEPGVTQSDLYRFLREQGGKFVFSVTGSSPVASIIGNLCERGVGLHLNPNYFTDSSAYEIVLGSGEIITSGFGRFKNSSSGLLFKHGIGPSLDGLFTQSNFGIVTAIALWLTPRPEYTAIVACNFETDTELLQAIPSLRKLRMTGGLQGAVHIANDLRVISSFQQYPFEQTGNRTPLPPHVQQQLRRKWKVAAWNLVAGLWGTKLQVRADIAAIKKALHGVAKPNFVHQSHIRAFERFASVAAIFKKDHLLERAKLFRLFEGEPIEGPLLGPYWRKKAPAPAHGRNPARDRCGVLWASPVIPARSEDVARMIQITSSLVAKFGFEFNAALLMVSERAICSTIAILFDAAVESEKSSALECYSALLSQLCSVGYYPYRAGIDADFLKPEYEHQDPAYLNLLRRLKSACDPCAILSPGRYGLY